jgi:hypothetical protein
MKKFLDKLKEFNKAFNIEVSGSINNPSMMRYELAKEENEEYIQATGLGMTLRRKEVVDAIGDQLYILCGTIVEHGLEDEIEEVFDIIHESNMSKLDDNGKPIVNDGVLDERKPVNKILKSKNFVEPDFTEVLKRL